jgi:hypothetical protein
MKNVLLVEDPDDDDEAWPAEAVGAEPRLAAGVVVVVWKREVAVRDGLFGVAICRRIRT